jgi:hypothetical protein
MIQVTLSVKELISVKVPYGFYYFASFGSLMADLIVAGLAEVGEGIG